MNDGDEHGLHKWTMANSLREKGLYLLHGTPYMFAPEEQTRVPLRLARSGLPEIDDGRHGLRRAVPTQPMSHDNFSQRAGDDERDDKSLRDQKLDLFSGCVSRKSS